MDTFKVNLEIRAECEDDVRELIEDYSGQETDIVINSIEEIQEDE